MQDTSKTVNTKIKFDSDSEEEPVAMETDEPVPEIKSQNQDKNLLTEVCALFTYIYTNKSMKFQFIDNVFRYTKQFSK